MGCAVEIENMLEIKVYEAGSQEEISSFEAWRRAFDINELIYTELCHEFYSTYEFDELCANDELRTKKVNEEGFNVYFQGGLRGDENFNAMDYWLSVSIAKGLHLSSSLDSTIRSPILRVLEKMITYGLCQRTTGYDKVLNSLSVPNYCRALDTTTLRELIDSEGRLIPEVPALGVPRVAILRGPRPFMQDLYKRIGSMEIRQGAIERMAYRQSYH
uniref:Uncharacterized protein n=1 Tax=Tanacetum cinerariifolium TaxID=118510 RepID=A0A6L2LCU0_TANCI|nr:hypothetical protein [Tanacetum cinerariifolium]